MNPARNAGARLLSGDSSWHRSGADGAFQFSGVPGSRQLEVRASGFMPATVLITMPADSGIDVLAALETRSMTINEICGRAGRIAIMRVGEVEQSSLEGEGGLR